MKKNHKLALLFVLAVVPLLIGGRGCDGLNCPNGCIEYGSTANELVSPDKNSTALDWF